MTLKLSPFAEKDLAESMEWYKEAKEGLDVMFLKEVDEILHVILRNPKAYRVRHRRKGLEIRFAPVSKFPFVVIYFIDLKFGYLVVQAFWHTSRNPENWKNRM